MRISFCLRMVHKEIALHFISFHGFVHVCAMSESFLKRSLIGSWAPVYQNSDDIWHIICSHRVSEPRLIASNGISINIFSFSSFCCCTKRLTQLECEHCCTHLLYPHTLDAHAQCTMLNAQCSFAHIRSKIQGKLHYFLIAISLEMQFISHSLD